MNEKIKYQKEEISNVCEECKKVNENVSQNLIMYGYKICESCRLSKTIFPSLTYLAWPKHSYHHN